jgi:NAD(P)-dependent dehydrogenase (short-subunit alcohol dehydrogenase family)
MDTPVVLITGALTGIGRAAAVAFAKKWGGGRRRPP